MQDTFTIKRRQWTTINEIAGSLSKWLAEVGGTRSPANSPKARDREKGSMSDDTTQVDPLSSQALRTIEEMKHLMLDRLDSINERLDSLSLNTSSTTMVRPVPGKSPAASCLSPTLSTGGPGKVIGSGGGRVAGWGENTSTSVNLPGGLVSVGSRACLGVGPAAGPKAGRGAVGSPLGISPMMGSVPSPSVISHQNSPTLVGEACGREPSLHLITSKSELYENQELQPPISVTKSDKEDQPFAPLPPNGGEVVVQDGTDEEQRRSRQRSHDSTVSFAPEQEEVDESTLLFLPDCWTVSLLEIGYLCATCWDCVVVTGAAATNHWDIFPSTAMIVAHSFATAISCAILFIRPKIAIFKGWQLVDDNPKFVQDAYLKSWLWFDLFQAVPWDLIALPFSLLSFRILSSIRFFRIVRFNSLFKTSNPLTPRRYQVFMGFISVLLAHHFIACVHVCARYECDGGPRSSMIEYTESLYWAIQTTTSVGYGDIPEDRLGMRWLALTVMLVGSGLYGWVIGQISAYLASQDHIQKKEQEQKDMINSLLHRYEVPLSIQKEAFTLYPLIFGAQSRNFTDAVELLPEFMQDKIYRHITVKLLKGVPMFAGAETFILRSLAQRLSRVVAEPDCVLINIGDIGKEMYFISTGAVQVLAPDSTGKLEKKVMLRDGSWFGEIALLKETRRTAVIRTITACDLFMLMKEDFWDLLQRHPQSKFEKAIFAEVERRLQTTTVRPPSPTGSERSKGNPSVSPKRKPGWFDPQREKDADHILQDGTVGCDEVEESNLEATGADSGEGEEERAPPQQQFKRMLALARLKRVSLSLKNLPKKKDSETVAPLGDGEISPDKKLGSVMSGGTGGGTFFGRGRGGGKSGSPGGRASRSFHSGRVNPAGSAGGSLADRLRQARLMEQQRSSPAQAYRMGEECGLTESGVNAMSPGNVSFHAPAAGPDVLSLGSASAQGSGRARFMEAGFFTRGPIDGDYAPDLTPSPSFHRRAQAEEAPNAAMSRPPADQFLTGLGTFIRTQTETRPSVTSIAAPDLNIPHDPPEEGVSQDS
eukprot:Hpha_TRINITY_DN14691_c0_g1::TRINITY_DN14691_c0_g1_i1::g.47982::m.47982